jgi:uroporphyrinogen decarboxylase
MVMTSRERVERAIRFEAPDRVPFNFWMDRRRMAELDAELGADFRVTHYGADVIEGVSAVPFPTAQFEPRSGTAWMVRPLFEDWREVYQLSWPDPADDAIYQFIAEEFRKFPDRAIIGNVPNVLTYTESMIHQDELYMGMLTAPDEVKFLFGKIAETMTAVAETICRRFDVTALYVQDDVAFNRGLLISQEQLREFVLPCWKRVIDVGHACNKPVFFHSDGDVSPIWDLYCDELGVRMLNPLQPNLQDLGDYKRRFHGRMGCYGGLETAILHQLTPAQITRHVTDLFEKCGQGGGLIMSTHDIDYSITREQLDALVAAIKSCTYA